MAPKRKNGGRGGGRGKKPKIEPASGPPDLSGKESYCSEVGIDISNGGSQAVYQWLCCSIIFGNRISEKTTIRAAKGLINSGLTNPKSVKDASWQEKVDALNSEGNVQRGPSMSDRLEATAAAVLEKYDGDLSKLRAAAKNNPTQIRKLVKEFKGIGETGVDIFFREAQAQWEELYPFADKKSLNLAKEHGYPSKNAKELAEFVGNDRAKFVALLAALTKDELRKTDILGDKPAETNGKELSGKEEATGEKQDIEMAEKSEEPKEKEHQTENGEGKEEEPPKPTDEVETEVPVKKNGPEKENDEQPVAHTEEEPKAKDNEKQEAEPEAADKEN